jgi:hypothetical protein
LPILHRKEIADQEGCFSKLADKEFEHTFNTEFLNMIKEVKFKVCTIVIDKQAHKNTYVNPEHPYHYCLELLLERYVAYLGNVKGTGDVLAESRGGKEDLELKGEYEKFYEKGSQYQSLEKVQKHLTSKQIKMKKKSEKIEGLELADLLSVPTKLDVLQTYGQITLEENFNKQIIEALKGKYYCSPVFGNLKGYGKKLI